MKINSGFRFIVVVCLLLAVSVPYLFANGQDEIQSEAVEPIVLKAVSFGPLTHSSAAPLQKFMERVKAQSNGALVIQHLGASEVTPLYDQPEALRTGVFDILITFPAAYVGIMPIAGGINLGNLDPPEWRKSGAHDFLVDAHKKINMMYFGSFASYDNGSYLYLNKKISKPEELAGMKFASGPTNLLSIVAWEGSGVRVPMAEKYSALERKIVDGAAGVLASHYSDSLYEVTTGWLPYSLGSALTCMLMNLDSWNNLPPDMQDMINEIMVDVEKETVGILKADADEMRKKLQDEGMEMIQFSAADAKRFLDVSLAAQWAVIEKSVDPAVVSRFKAMLNK